jgi:mannose-6-phosphate isomerase-like protein (cupin superfamily)
MTKPFARILPFILALAAAGAAQGQSDDQPRYVASRALSAMATGLPGGGVSAPVPTGPGATVVVVRRDKSGEVEVHRRFNDEIVVRSGHAAVLIGAKVEGGRETAPGEWRGGTIVGGQLYDLSPGDVLWIPAGLAHQAIVPKGRVFEYLAIKFEVKPAP